MMNAVIVGLGSIGSKHYSLCTKNGLTCYTIDPRVPNSLLNSKTHFKSSEKFLDFYTPDPEKSTNSIVVIANWGPDHVSEVKKFVAKGFSNFLIEKPLAATLRDLTFLDDQTTNPNLKLWANYHLRFDSGMTRLREFIDSGGLGPIELFVLSGGAKCLSTTGIHWLDLFYEFSDTEPELISGDFISDAVNPRGEHLAYLSGFLYCRNQDNSKFIMSFTNSSFSSERIDIYWRNHKGEIVNDKIRVYENEAQKSLPINRTNTFGKLVYEGILSGDGMNLLHASFLNAPNSMQRLTKANRILLTALSSDFTKKYESETRKNHENENNWFIS